MEHWLDGTQPDRPDTASGPDGDLFAVRRAGARTRAVRAGRFHETADATEVPRSEAVPALSGGTAPYPAYTDTAAPDTTIDLFNRPPTNAADPFLRPEVDVADPFVRPAADAEASFPGPAADAADPFLRPAADAADPYRRPSRHAADPFLPPATDVTDPSLRPEADAADPFPGPDTDAFEPFGPADAAAGAVRRAGAGAGGASDDTDELTVQLGGVGPAAAGAPGGRPESPDGTGSPVFVDESGRRSRRLRWLGAAIGVLCSVYALVIVATLVSGNSGAPWLPLPGLDGDTPAAKVETSSVPSASASPSGSADAVPGAGTTGSAATAPSAGGAAAEPSGATTNPARPQASTLPEVSTTGSTTVKPTSPATASGPAAPESPAASPEASQPEGGGEASPTAVEDTGGTGEVAGDANSLSSAG